ncbi:nucleotide-sugar transporter-domain-containing protein [Gamsiella multidivaricata]|uniref:nucleotide-sugar transporter-domain-containing protein n=1 Tax=Gamsiella multidivaricata TaxID=101098 RepID=UPI00221F63EE|nr:nucleotide-sugar transporter-domain-containing protein [Gamsiella multidivaricata]KAI7817169.1 nucleotide-sugar transporter-domain-containing protein [Gamsiella multidivaricata]
MPSVGGIPLKYISLVVLAVQNSLLIIVMALAQGVGRKPFYSSTAVFLNEIVKLIVCTGITIHETIKDTGRFYPQDFINEVFGGDAWKLAIPAMLYAIQNNLQYVASHALDPSTFQVTYQLKILTTALFSVILLHRSLPGLKWLALVMLTAGIALVSLEESNNRASQRKGVHSPDSASSALGALLEEQKNDALYQAAAAAPRNERPEFVVGLLSVMIACVLSGLAGVYFEKILKNTQGSIWLRNIQLSFFSLPFSLLAIYLKDGEGVTEQGFFAGYDMLVIAAITCQAAGGFIVAVVVKYADNILKGFATSISIIISAIASVALFGSHIGIVFVIGTSLVLGATYLYSLPDKPVVKYVDLGSQLDSFHAEEGRLGSPRRGSNDTVSTPTSNSPSVRLDRIRVFSAIRHTLAQMLQDRFKSASAFMAKTKNLNLPTSTKLSLYADYKLATEGLCTQGRPSLIEFEKAAKWKTWKETGERYTQELNTPNTNIDEDSAQLTLEIKAMISYVQRVEEGQWGWTFDPTTTDSVESGDRDLDELEAYLGMDTDEVSAEELLARPYVPIQGQIEGATMTASGISTLAAPVETDQGEDVLESAKTGSVQAMLAALKSNPNIVSHKDDMGCTMLHWTCDRGSLDKVRVLVEQYHADVNAQDAEGSTPLHYACLSGWPEIIAYLKDLPNVDQAIKDNSGMTAEECLE